MKGAVTTYVVYDHPSDFPDKFVVRRHYSNGQGVWADPNCTTHDSIEEARASLPVGLFYLGKQLEIDPVIAEVWI